MKNNLKPFAAAFCVAMVTGMMPAAQEFAGSYSTVQCSTPADLVDKLLGSGVELVRSEEAATVNGTLIDQIGFFSGLKANAVPAFTNGVIISTGYIANGSSTKNQMSDWGGDSMHSNTDDYNQDADLKLLFPDAGTHYDPAGIVVYVRPKHQTINIPFMMASEEFYYGATDPESPSLENYEAGSDKFAFFLQDVTEGDGAAPMVNIATLPNGESVEIATVNQHVNTEFFIPNIVVESGNLVFPAEKINLPMEYNGAIVGPVAVTNVIPGHIYKLKIVIADFGIDNTLDSTVFLKECGITSGADLAIEVTGPEVLAEPGPATFTNIVSNIGEIAADGVVVTNYLPSGISPENVSVVADGIGTVGDWQQAGGTNFCIWTIGDHFAAGSTARMRVVCTQDLPSGSYTNLATVSASQGDYEESNNTAEFKVKVNGEAPELPTLTVTAISTNWTYGAALNLNPLQYIQSLNTNGTQQVTVTGITVEFLDAEEDVVTLDKIALAAAGTYTIRLRNLAGTGLTETFGDNVNFVDGTLTVNKRKIWITASDRLPDKTYGERYMLVGDECTVTDEEGNEYDPSDDTLARFQLFGQDYVDVSLTCGATDKTALPDEYDIAVGYELAPAALANYEVHTVPSKMRVAQRAITIEIGDTNKVYGTELALDGKLFKIVKGSLLADDRIDSLDLKSDGTNEVAAVTAEGGEGYPIEAVKVKESNIDEVERKYAITYENGSLEVKKRNLTIVAKNVTNEYGAVMLLDQTAFRIDEATPLPAFEQVTNVTITSTKGTTAIGDFPEAIVPSHVILGSHTMPDCNFDVNNYKVTFVPATLTVTPAELTINVNDNTWRIGKENPDEPYGYVSFLDRLRNGDTEKDVTGAIATFTNATRGANYVPADDEVGNVYENEIWLALNGAKKGNYKITVKPGDLTIKSAEVKLAVVLEGAIDWWTGCEKLKFTVTNEGDDVPEDYDYWVQLKPVTNNEGQVESCLFKGMKPVSFVSTNVVTNSVLVTNIVTTGVVTTNIVKTSVVTTNVVTTHKFEMIRVNQMTNGYDYVDLTAAVTNALASTGNRDTVFDKAEQVTIEVDDLSFYYCTSNSARKLMKDFFGTPSPTDFFMAGKLFNPGDKNHDFVVSEDEKLSDEMKALLGVSVSDYLEMTRLSLLQYYYWDAEKGTWIGPKR